jgi:hypothetical protein
VVRSHVMCCDRDMCINFAITHVFSPDLPRPHVLGIKEGQRHINNGMFVLL